MSRAIRLLAVGGAVGVALRLGRLQPPDRVRRFINRTFNPTVMRLGLAGGRRSPWGVLEHVGRASGTLHRTPLWAQFAGDHVYVRLTYGRDVHWVRNVEAAGRCRLVVHGRAFELDEPLVVTARDRRGVPWWSRSAFASRRYLRLHVRPV